jgi:uncharacterized protein (DUF2235 family)
MKNIIFCADGTWNGTDVDEDHDGVPDSTNVLKLFHLLQGDTTLESRRLKDEAEKTLNAGAQLVQIAKYLHGVGDSSNPLMKLLGGAFGTGLIARIVRGYTFISRNYEAGDRVFIVGFSRGAYTARALGGMISSVGLLNSARLHLKDDKEMAYTLGVAAWRKYREIARDRQQNVTLKQKLADLVSNLPGYARIPLQQDDLIAAPITAVAVWDTVGALGIPDFNGSSGQAADAYRFADDMLSANVQYGIHAVSYDELRQSFQPTLWRSRDRIKQYWFAGAHADVGGGYPVQESNLSNIALKWMIEELAAIGVLFKPFPADWSTREDAPYHEPWKEGVFKLLPKAPREWGAYQLVEHASFSARKMKLRAATAGDGSPRFDFAVSVDKAGVAAREHPPV